MTAGDDRPDPGPDPTDATSAPAGESAPRPQAGDDVQPEAGDDVQPEGAEPGPVGAGELLTELEAQLAERTADVQRVQAELVNYRRRVERDRELVKQNATFAVLTSLMPVLDDVDRAREHGEVEGGFKAVADSLDRAVSALGLTKFGATGEEFDPNLHEALMHGHSAEVTTTTVDKVVQAGYRIGERVVRAAKVTVLDPEA